MVSFRTGLRSPVVWLALGLPLILACNFLAPAPSTPPPDLLGTLQASTPVGDFPTQPPADFPTPQAEFPTLAPTLPAQAGSVPAPSAADGLTGHIVYTCQVYKVQAADQICIMNADGSGMRKLTTNNNVRHFYPSLSPDGQSVLYSSFREQNVYEIYRLQLSDGKVDRLTDKLGVLTAAEYAPDGQSIVFAKGDPVTSRYQIMLTNADGGNPKAVPDVSGWDPTWSPDGNQILFASASSGLVQLYSVDRSGKGLRQLTNLPSIRGRSDWSEDGQYIVTYSGEPWHREVYIMNGDGSNVRQLTPTGGNSQGPSISPDGKWVAFTAYFDHYGEDLGCEIYIIRVDGTDLRRLTNNDYCDYQPRWGP